MRYGFEVRFWFEGRVSLFYFSHRDLTRPSFALSYYKRHLASSWRFDNADGSLWIGDYMVGRASDRTVEVPKGATLLTFVDHL